MKRSTPPDHSAELDHPMARVSNNTCETLHENTESFPEEPLNMISKSSLENKCVLQLQRVKTTKMSRSLTLETDPQTQSKDSSSEQKPIDSLDTTYSVEIANHSRPLTLQDNKSDSQTQSEDSSSEQKPIDSMYTTYSVEIANHSRPLTLRDNKSDSQTQSEDSSPEQKPIDSMDTTSSDGQSHFQSQSDGSEREGVIDEQSHSKKKKTALEIWNELQAAVSHEYLMRC